MREAAQEYLTLRRSLGSELKQAGQLLADFAACLDADSAEYLTVEAAVAWATAPDHVTAYWHWWRLYAIRGFSTYLHAIDDRHEVIPGDLLPYNYTRATPYLFTDAEVVALMQAAGRLSRRLPALTYQALIGLLAVTGMRPGEAYALDRCHLDLQAGALTIAHSKNGISRRLPLHASTVAALAGYAHRRDQLYPYPAQPSFLVSVRGTRLIPNVADGVFKGLARSAGLTPRSARTRPLLKSFRHTFAVNTLIGWYQAGADIDARMPALSNWLGHTGPRSTYWYISATPELLALAVAKMTSTAAQPQASDRPYPAKP